jgi:hypothetical protein
VNAWEVVLLSAFRALGGSAELRDIYLYLERHALMRPHHTRPTKWGGRPAYQHQVRSHVVNLMQAGDLTRLARGHYVLTPKGRARL